MKTIKHRIDGAWVIYSESAVIFKSIVGRSLEIPWEQIDFFSPTPAVKFINDSWYTFDGIDISGDKALHKMKFLSIHMVIKDVTKLNYGKGKFDKIIGRLLFPIFSNMANGMGGFDPAMASCEYYIKRRSLNVPLRELLDLMNTKSRFDLVCIWDV